MFEGIENTPSHTVWAACESPIEQYLCCGLFTFLGCKAVFGEFDAARLPELAEIAGDRPACFLFSQHQIGTYRADFLLVAVDPQRRTSRRLVVECDGRQYHTGEEQEARDRLRDSEISGRGYKVVRFSGSVLHSDLPSAIEEIKQWAEAAGVACTPAGGAEILGWFTPSREKRERRRYEREAYWREELAGSQVREPDFISDCGGPGRWADTL